MKHPTIQTNALTGQRWFPLVCPALPCPSPFCTPARARAFSGANEQLIKNHQLWHLETRKTDFQHEPSPSLDPDAGPELDLASPAESGCCQDTQRAGVALDGLAHRNQPRPPTDNPFLGHHLPGRHVKETSLILSALCKFQKVPWSYGFEKQTHEASLSSAYLWHPLYLCVC